MSFSGGQAYCPKKTTKTKSCSKSSISSSPSFRQTCKKKRCAIWNFCWKNKNRRNGEIILISKSLWARLTPANRRRYKICIIRLENFARLRRMIFHPAFRFMFFSATLSFVLLNMMPKHPMAIPTSIGGGVSILLISTSGMRVFSRLVS